LLNLLLNLNKLPLYITSGNFAERVLSALAKLVVWFLQHWGLLPNSCYLCANVSC